MRARLWVLSLGLGLVFGCVVSGQAGAQVAGTRPGGRIADSVATFLEPRNLEPFLGFGCNIVEKGQPDFVFSHGSINNGGVDAWTDSTIFNLGSVSKLFTAIAVAKLAHEGLLQLDDPVYYHFPEFLEIQGKNGRAPEVTLLDLLQHKSGMTQSMEHLFPEKFGKEAVVGEGSYYENTFNYRAFMNTEDFRNRFLMYARLDHAPGRRYQYSNLNYVLLGYILEEVVGINLGAFVTNKIFAPLGMNDSHFYITPDSMTQRLAWGYYRLSDGSYLNVHDNEVESPSPTGDGGIKTSQRDMLKFMHFLMGDYRQPRYDEVLPRAVLLSLMAPQQRGPDKRTWIGVGFHSLQPQNLVGHAGGWDGFLTMLYYHPETHSALFLVTNREDNQLFAFLRIFAAYALLFQEFK
jgi:serine-type D-Ala-D-Ala carboxypeptidase/endopeptidase